MIWNQILTNRILIAALIAWLLAQFFKVPIQYMLHRKIDWGMWLSTGGMPSSHSALVTATMLAIGLYTGFNNPIFALSVAVAMVVIYDAAGVRRQAGMHAERINLIINELFSGQPVSEENLKEVLGHTPIEVIGGVFLGLIVSWGVWFFWH
jgi:acid phosphatase family membrane protein YuiD